MSFAIFRQLSLSFGFLNGPDMTDCPKTRKLQQLVFHNCRSVAKLLLYLWYVK